MKIAVSGKGGVGKTTVSSSLARHFATSGRRVIAIDADPDANLALALGATAEQAASCTPLSEEDDLIEERTGVRPGKGGMFRLNPDVSDVIGRCGVDIDGVTLLRMGTVERGGSGCMCAEGTFLQAFMRHLVLQTDDVAILDMEAGIEHLGRGTARGVDAFVVVIEPGGRSVQTAGAVSKLAADLGVTRIVAVANKVRGAEDLAFVREALGEIELLGVLPDSDAVRAADRLGKPPIGVDDDFDSALLGIAEKLEAMSAEHLNAHQ